MIRNVTVSGGFSMDALYGVDLCGSLVVRYDTFGNKETGRIIYGGFPDGAFCLHWTHDLDGTSEMLFFPDSAWFATLRPDYIASIERISSNTRDLSHQPDPHVTRYVIVLDR